MTKAVVGYRFGNAGATHCLFKGTLDHRFVKVMAALEACTSFVVPARGRKYPLPGPLHVGVRILADIGVFP